MFVKLACALVGAASACFIATVNKHAVGYTRELFGLAKASDTMTGGVRRKYQRSKKQVLQKTIAKKLSAHKAAPSRDAASKAKGKKPASETKASKAKGKKPASPQRASNRNNKVAEGLVSSPQKLIDEREVNEANIEGSASNVERHYKILTFVMPQKDEDVVGATKGEGKLMFVLGKKNRHLILMGILDGPNGNSKVLDTHVIPKQSCTWIVQVDEVLVTDENLICIDVFSLLASADNTTSHGYVVQGEMVDIVKKCVEKVRQMHADNRK